MNLDETLIDNNGVYELANEILKYADEVPFGNSDFQNKHVIVDMEKSPHRAFRHASLRILDRLNALNECYYTLRENEITIKKLERDLESEKDELERELIQIKIDKIKSNYPYTKKLIKDAIREIEVLYPIIKNIGYLSREDFEKYELEYFKNKYITQLTKDSVEDSLDVLTNNSTLYNIIVNSKENQKQVESK